MEDFDKIEIEDIAESENEAMYFSVTSYGADYTVSVIVSKMKKDQLIVPDFQRKYVWDLMKASRFIESLILGLPVPGIFLSKDPENPNKLLIIDGQQRLISLLNFYTGRFKDKIFKLASVCPQLEGKTYDELSLDDQSRLDDAIIHATIIKQESPSDNNNSIYMIFERLNTGGVTLQPQEIRACIYYGGLNDLLNELIQTPSWRSLFKKENKRMKEQELILRFFALYYCFETYKKGLKKFLNDFMCQNRNFENHEREELRSLFVSTINLLVNAKGTELFKRGALLNAALFDSIMIGVAKRMQAKDLSLQDCAALYDSLLSDEEYISYTTTSTADEKHLKGRIAKAIEHFA